MARQTEEVDPVLARAAELYAEGMEMEEVGNPQQALDRYRRAVRMADERRILAWLAQARDSTSQASSGSMALVSTGPELGERLRPPTSKDPRQAEEEFQLWRAMHLSRLEASAADAASPAVDSASNAHSTAAAAAISTPGAAAPAEEGAPLGQAGPPSQPPAQRPRPERDEHGNEEEEELAHSLALRHLEHKFGKGEPDLGGVVTDGRNVRAAAESGGGGAHGAAMVEDEESDCAFLRLLLQEGVPLVCLFLDAYSLDRASGACRPLRQQSRASDAWRALARRCVPKAHYERALQLSEFLSAPHSSLALGEEPSWRRMVLLTPRLRADGVYVAQCGYRRRVQKGSSLTDTRESLYINYYRLLRILPENSVEEEPQRRVLVLTYEGDLATAVEAMKLHPVGRAATFGGGGGGLKASSSEHGGNWRKIHDRVVVGTFALDAEAMVAGIRYSDARNEYLMEFKLQHARRGARQNCRMTWLRYEFTSLTIPQEGGSFDLHREQHYSPYAFARIRTLEHLM